MLVFGFRRRLFILEEDVTLGLVVNQQTLPEYKRCHYTFAPSLKECQTSADNLLIVMSLLLGIFLRIFSHSSPVTSVTLECPRTSPNRPRTSKNHPRSPQNAPNSPRTPPTVLKSPQSSIGNHPNNVTPITPECPRTPPNRPRTSKNHPTPPPECPN